MDNLGIEIISTHEPREQYILYNVDYSKLCDSMPNTNTMKRIFLPTLEMANNVRSSLSYFICNFDRGYRGGELARGIGKSMFSRVNDDELMNSSGHQINVHIFVQRAQELRKYKYNNNLPKYYYNEYMLTVLRYTILLPIMKII
jgi:hypothetical protein